MDPIQAIPHRPPIRCVEQLVEASEEHCIALARAPEAWEPWLIEGLAQTAALLNATAYGETERGMLVQVRRFEIARPPRADEQLTMRVDVVIRLSPVHLLRGEVRDAAGDVIATGELKFYVEPNVQPA